MIRVFFNAACAAFLLLTMCFNAAASGSDLARLAGRKVLGIEIQGAAVDRGELAVLVPFSEGSVLKPGLVREGIRNFYRTGLYDMVEVFAIDLPEGIIVRFTLNPKQWLEQVEFQGNLYVDKRQLLSRIDLRSNEELTKDKLAYNVERLKAYYEYRGFAESEIETLVDSGPDSRSVVTFSIREGRKRTISDIRVMEESGISRGKLLRMISSMPGSALDGVKLDNDLERLRTHLRKKMYLVPVLNYRIAPSARFTNASVVIFGIETGPEFKLQVIVDDEKESQRQTKKMQSVFLEAATPEKAKLTMEKLLLDGYRKEGYPFVAASYEDIYDGSGTRSITLKVERGPKTITGKVSIVGAGFFTEDRVRESLGLVRGEPFVIEHLEDGMERVELQYRREGYLGAVISRKPLDYLAGEDQTEVTINLVVQEGIRNMLRSLDVSGSPLVDEKTLALLGFAEGDPYVPEIVSRGRDALLQELGSMGYLYASIQIDEPAIDSSGMVDLAVTVKAGPMVRLGTVIVQGNELVDARIIRLALDLKRGEVLTRQKILKAQDRIYSLKVMSSVDVLLAEPQTPGGNKDLLVRVQERPRYVVGFRAGYGSEDKLRGEASVTNRNVGSMARSLTLSGRASAVERDTTMLYTHPWFHSLPIDMTISLSDLVEERESYSRDSFSAAVDFVRELSDRTETRFGYFFEGLRLFDVSPDAQLSPDDEGRTDVAALVGEILHDARDDFLDPWDGFLGDIILEVAAKNLGSKTEYVKAELAVRRYMNPVDDLVLAGLVRLGRVQAYGDSEEVIISKRFFLGGQNSVRGYRLDSLGPRDTDGDPIGGNYLFNANLELRYPLYKTLRGVVFLDTGSVWLESAADPEDEKFRLRSSTGAGLRWSSPIGPLSLDYGYKVNPAEEDEDDRYRWHLSIGHAF